MIMLLISGCHVVVLHASKLKEHTFPKSHAHPLCKFAIGQSSERHKVPPSLQDAKLLLQLALTKRVNDAINIVQRLRLQV